MGGLPLVYDILEPLFLQGSQFRQDLMDIGFDFVVFCRLQGIGQGVEENFRMNAIEGDIIFEYDIVRLGKRIDVILLIRHMVFSLEFKNGKEIFTAQDAQQAEDYAIDIKNFHKESENLYVCPILIATDAAPYAKAQ